MANWRDREVHYPTLFSELHTAAAERFGWKWLQAQERTLRTIRRVAPHLDNEITASDRKLAYLISVAVFETLNVSEGWDTAEKVAEKMTAKTDEEMIAERPATYAGKVLGTLKCSIGKSRP